MSEIPLHKLRRPRKLSKVGYERLSNGAPPPNSDEHGSPSDSMPMSARIAASARRKGKRRERYVDDSDRPEEHAGLLDDAESAQEGEFRDDEEQEQRDHREQLATPVSSLDAAISARIFSTLTSSVAVLLVTQVQATTGQVANNTV